MITAVVRARMMHGDLLNLLVWGSSTPNPSAAHTRISLWATVVLFILAAAWVVAEFQHWLWRPLSMLAPWLLCLVYVLSMANSHISTSAYQLVALWLTLVAVWLERQNGGSGQEHCFTGICLTSTIAATAAFGWRARCNWGRRKIPDEDAHGRSIAKGEEQHAAPLEAANASTSMITCAIEALDTTTDLDALLVTATAPSAEAQQTKMAGTDSAQPNVNPFDQGLQHALNEPVGVPCHHSPCHHSEKDVACQCHAPQLPITAAGSQLAIPGDQHLTLFTAGAVTVQVTAVKATVGSDKSSSAIPSRGVSGAAVKSVEQQEGRVEPGAVNEHCIDSASHRQQHEMDSAHLTSAACIMVERRSGAGERDVRSISACDLASRDNATLDPQVMLGWATSLASVGSLGNVEQELGSSSTLPTVTLPDGPDAVAEACRRVRNMLAIGGRAAMYSSRVKRTHASLKLPWADPTQLPATFLADLDAALRTMGSGVLVGASLRRGCIELTIELLDMEVNGPMDVNGPPNASAHLNPSMQLAAGGDSRRVVHRPRSSGLDRLPLPEMLHALGVAPGLPSTPATTGRLLSHHQGGSLTDEPDWHPSLSVASIYPSSFQSDSSAHGPAHATLGMGSAGAWLAEPGSLLGSSASKTCCAVVSAAGQAPRALTWDAAYGEWRHSSPPQATATQVLGVQPWCLQAGTALPGDRITLNITLSCVPHGAGTGSFRFVVSAGGRTRVALEVPGTWMAMGGAAEGESAGAATGLVHVSVEVTEVSSLLSVPGLMLVEVWQGYVVCGQLPVLLAPSAAVMAEVMARTPQLAAGPSAEGQLHIGACSVLSFMPVELSDLLTDMGRWAEFCATAALATRRSEIAAGEADADAASQVSARRLALAAQWTPAAAHGEVQGIALGPSVAQVTAATVDLQAPMMLAAAQALLEHAVDVGLTATADWVLGGLLDLPAHLNGGGPQAALDALTAGSLGASAGCTTGMPLLHRVMCRGSRALLEAVVCRADAAGCTWHWDECALLTSCSPVAEGMMQGDLMLSPMHVAALSEAGSDEGSVEWLLSTQPAAAAAWFLSGGVSGLSKVTPAQLAEAVGMGHLTLLAAATLAADRQARTGAAHAAPTITATAAAAASVPAATPDVTAAAVDANSSSRGRDLAAVETADVAVRAVGAIVWQSWCGGFTSPWLEAQFGEHVGARTMSITRLWAMYMVLAHTIVIARSGDDRGGQLQALVGAAGYGVALAISCLAPTLFARHRDAFMTGAVLGRTCARSLIAGGICSTSACSSAFKAYVGMHLDVLLDSILEGTFSATRVPRAMLLRATDMLVTSTMYLHDDMFGFGFAFSVGRAVALNMLGLAVTLVTDVMWRVSFVRKVRAQAAGCTPGTGARVGDGLKPVQGLDSGRSSNDGSDGNGVAVRAGGANSSASLAQRWWRRVGSMWGHGAPYAAQSVGGKGVSKTKAD